MCKVVRKVEAKDEWSFSMLKRHKIGAAYAITS